VWKIWRWTGDNCTHSGVIYSRRWAKVYGATFSAIMAWGRIR
jgi:hypothetical protein